MADSVRFLALRYLNKDHSFPTTPLWKIPREFSEQDIADLLQAVDREMPFLFMVPGPSEVTIESLDSFDRPEQLILIRRMREFESMRYMGCTDGLNDWERLAQRARSCIDSMLGAFGTLNAGHFSIEDEFQDQNTILVTPEDRPLPLLTAGPANADTATEEDAQREDAECANTNDPYEAWFTVREAAQLWETEDGNVSRAKGIRDNGKTQKARRLHPKDVLREYFRRKEMRKDITARKERDEDFGIE